MSIRHSSEEFKAWNQNFGHEHVLTTFLSYGTVSEDRQRENPEKIEADPRRVAVLRNLIEDAFNQLGDTRG